jgi:hypothetical protein
MTEWDDELDQSKIDAGEILERVEKSHMQHEE